MTSNDPSREVKLHTTMQISESVGVVVTRAHTGRSVSVSHQEDPEYAAVQSLVVLSPAELAASPVVTSNGELPITCLMGSP